MYITEKGFFVCFVLVKGLDFVIYEAKNYGIKLVLSLVNNYEDYGGKKQYVEWAKTQGQFISSVDDFYTNPVVKGFYKNHIKVKQILINDSYNISRISI